MRALKILTGHLIHNPAFTYKFQLSATKGIVDQCHVEDLILVPAGHYWTRKTGLVDYYQPEWDCDGYTG